MSVDLKNSVFKGSSSNKSNEADNDETPKGKGNQKIEKTGGVSTRKSNRGKRASRVKSNPNQEKYKKLSKVYQGKNEVVETERGLLEDEKVNLSYEEELKRMNSLEL